MQSILYKRRQGKMVSGVCAGLADKFGWDLGLTRVITAILMYFMGFGVLLYILLAIFLPYKEDQEAQQFGQGPRRRKDAEVIDEQEKDNWFW